MVLGRKAVLNADCLYVSERKVPINGIGHGLDGGHALPHKLRADEGHVHGDGLWRNDPQGRAGRGAGDRRGLGARGGGALSGQRGFLDGRV